MSDRVFEVTYRVGMGDLNAFFGVWWKRTWFDKANWRRFGIYALAIEALMLAGTWPTLTGRVIDASFNTELCIVLGIAELIGSLFFALPLVFVVGPVFTYIAQLTVFTFGPARKRASHLKATADGVDKITGETESQAKWGDFTAVTETKKTVLLFTRRNSATIVPKSAFTSLAEAEAFAAFAKAQWEDARSVF